MFIGKTLDDDQRGSIYLNVNDRELFVWTQNSKRFSTQNLNETYYLAHDCRCDYDWVSSAKGSKIPQALKYIRNGETVYVARAFLQGEFHLGKVGTGSKKFFYADNSRVEIYEGNYEVLVCNPKECSTKQTTKVEKTPQMLASEILSCSSGKNGGDQKINVFCPLLLDQNKTCVTQDLVIESFAEKVFYHKPDPHDLLTPESLIVQQQLILFLPTNLGKEFPLLKILEVSRSGLLLIEQKHLSGLGRLEQLNLTGNKIWSIGSGSLIDLKKLAVLDLSFNRIESIKAGSFKGLDQLLNLHLNDNQIKEITPQFSSPMKKLEFVNLYNNDCGISSYPESSLVQIEAEVLDKCRGPVEFKCVKTRNPHACVVDQLNVERRQTRIEKIGTQNADNITELSVNKQILKFLPRNLVKTFPKLQRILVLSSRLTTLGRTDFDGLSRLRFIEIINNELKSIDAKTFYAVPQLEYLDLSSNRIRSLPAGLCTPLSMLVELRLTHNNIKVLEANVLPAKSNLRVFRIDLNQLERVDLVGLEVLKENVEDMDFRGNKCIEKNYVKLHDNGDDLRSMTAFLEQMRALC